MPFGRFLRFLFGTEPNKGTNRMTQERGQEGNATLEERKLLEVVEMFDSVTLTLSELVQDIQTGKGAPPRQIKAQLADLQSAYFSIKKAEEAFHDKTGHIQRAGDIDFEAVRDSIGSKLDKLRNAKAAEQVSQESD